MYSIIKQVTFFIIYDIVAFHVRYYMKWWRTNGTKIIKLYTWNRKSSRADEDKSPTSRIDVRGWKKVKNSESVVGCSFDWLIIVQNSLTIRYCLTTARDTDCIFFVCFFSVSGDLMDILALTNSAVSFILYCSVSQQFRTAFKEMFTSFFPKPKKKPKIKECSPDTAVSLL